MILSAKPYLGYFKSSLVGTSWEPSLSDDEHLELRVVGVSLAEGQRSISYTRLRNGLTVTAGMESNVIGPPWYLRAGRTYVVTTDIVGSGPIPGVLTMCRPNPAISRPPFVVVDAFPDLVGTIRFLISCVQDTRLEQTVPLAVLVFQKVQKEKAPRAEQSEGGGA